MKDFVQDIKTVYQAPDRVQAVGRCRMENLLIMQAKGGKHYPHAVQPWLEKWELLSPFFDYPTAVRKVMYTTNTVEGYHRQLRKVTKTKPGGRCRGFQFRYGTPETGLLTTQNLQIK